MSDPMRIEEVSASGCCGSSPQCRHLLTQVIQLWVYPVKSLRGTKLQSSRLFCDGFKYDRRYMFLQVHEDTTNPSGRRLENMHIAYFPAMALFTANYNPQKETLQVTYKPPPDAVEGSEKSKNIPLNPEVKSLKRIEVTMHKSPTVAYDMGETYNSWFSELFGYKVIFAYVGENRRPVLGNVSPSALAKGKEVAPPTTVTSGTRYWISTTLAIMCAAIGILVALLQIWGPSRFVVPVFMVWVVNNLMSDDSTWV